MLNIEAQDDPVQADGTPNFAGGLASYPPPAQLAPNQFALGVNTALNKLGEVQTRRGWEALPQLRSGGFTMQFNGMGYLETAGGVRKLLVVSVSLTARAYDGTSWSDAAGFTPTVSTYLSMAQGIDKLYLSNGTDNMRSWDGTTFVDLGNSGTNPPRAKFIVWGTNRLIAANDPTLAASGGKDSIWFSDILDPSAGHWPAANKIRVGAGDGQEITGIAMWTKTLLAVFKRTRIYLVNIDPAVSVSQFTIDEVPAAFGCLAPRTITRVGRDLWFLASDFTVRSLSRVLNGEESEITSASLPINDEFTAMDETTAANAEATFFKDRFLIAYNAFGSQYEIAAYNTQLNVWEGIWQQSNRLPRRFCITRFSDQERLMGGANSVAQVMRWRSYNSDAAEVAADFQDADADNGTAQIATQVRTRGHSFGADLNQKQGLALEVEFATSTAAAAAVKISADEAALTTLESVTPAGKVPLTLLHQAPFRGLQVDISATSGKLAVRAVRLSAFLNTMPVGT